MIRRWYAATPSSYRTRRQALSALTQRCLNARIVAVPRIREPNKTNKRTGAATRRHKCSKDGVGRYQGSIRILGPDFFDFFDFIPPRDII